MIHKLKQANISKDNKHWQRPRFLSSLRWKLTWPYIFVSPLFIFLLELIILTIAIIIIILNYMPTIVLYSAESYTPNLRPFFIRQEADREAIAFWLENQSMSFYPYQAQILVIVDKEGNILASRGSQELPAITSVMPYLQPEHQADLQQVLASGKKPQSIKRQSNNDRVMVVAPITDPDGTVQGAWVEDTGPDLGTRQIAYWYILYILIFIISLIFYAIYGLIIGLISNIIATRKITQRFQRVTIAANHWSQGDFSEVVHDSSQDEIGQLTRALNRMAEQLQNVLHTRQQLAILEERHRLARDLHDTVKQHTFVVTLQIGAARLLLQQNPKRAEEQLQQAEISMQKVQRDLRDTIQALRPIALDNDLNAALQELGDQWSHQHNITIQYHIETLLYPLPTIVEEALYRVAQETLSNVARHSQANHVELTLTQSEKETKLIITDNGKGFNPPEQPTYQTAQSTNEYQGYGLHSMKERMKRFGTIQIKSTLDKGTQIIAICSQEKLQALLQEFHQ